MNKLLLITALVGACMHLDASQRLRNQTNSRIPSSGAALGGNVPRNLPVRGITERLFEKYRPQPHQTAGRNIRKH